MPIRILIVDDHAVVRQSLRQVLDAQPDIQVVAEAADAAMAVQLATSLTPDVILMDLLMPEVSGAEATRRIIAQQSAMRIVVLTSSIDEQQVTEALQAGAQGYILKSSRVNDVIDAIRRVADGQTVLDPAAAQVLMQQTRIHDPLNTLTQRERDVFDHLAQGYTNAEIAQKLNIGEVTVRTHIAKLLEKLSLRDRTQVVIYALKRGLIRVDDLP